MVVADQGKPIFAEPHAFDDASWVGYRLAEILPVPLVAKQKLLELDRQPRAALNPAALSREPRARREGFLNRALARSFLTGAGTAAPIASSTGSQICPGSAARGDADSR